MTKRQLVSGRAKVEAAALLPLTGFVLLLVVWLVASAIVSGAPNLLPSPQATFGRLYGLLASGGLLIDLLRTLSRWSQGYLIGCLVGSISGLLVGTSRRAYATMEFPIEFLRSLPVTALFPLFLLLFGIGDASKIAMVFTATVFVVLINSAYGLLHAGHSRIRMAESFGASRVQVLLSVMLPEALPQMVVGIRLALSLSLIVVVVAEMFIGAQDGLGQRVFESYAMNSATDLYAVILLLGLLGYASNKLFLYLERVFIFWKGR